MKTSLAIATLVALLPQGLPVGLVGAPGVGKSDAVYQAAARLGWDVITSHPVVSDPTEAKGLPMPNVKKGVTEFLPYGHLKHAMGASKPTIWFLDDLGQATAATQAAFMQLLLARQIDGHRISDYVVFVAATNRREDMAGVSGLLEPVKSRFGTLLHIEADLRGWMTWAIANGISQEIIGFLAFRPKFFHDFRPTRDMTNSPTPRTWVHLDKMLRATGLPEEAIFEVAQGAVGTAAATEFTRFLKIHRGLPDVNAVLLQPRKAPIPTELSQRYALANALAYHANGANLGRVLDYAERLAEHGHAEVVAQMLTSLGATHPELRTAPEYVRVADAASPLSKILAASADVEFDDLPVELPA